MISSPYLQAIQNVAGSTPGEKYRTLNDIARRIIKESDVQDKTIRAQSSLELPEILVPLVNLEIAKIVRDPDRIVEALKSDDISIFNRALRTKWFFDGTIKTVTNVTYFQYHIFEWVSVKNRLQLIKTLSVHLAANRKKYIAEEFYSALSDMYGSAQPEPLLCACSESFIWQEITTRKLVLTARTVKKLFVKYSDIVVEYLKLSLPTNKPYNRNVHEIPMEKYISVLTRLLKDYTNVFVDLIKSNPCLSYNRHLKLGRKNTERLLKRATDAIIENSRVVSPFINIKSLTSKLTNEQFKLFFRNLFPIKTSEPHFRFSFRDMYEYLEYYPSSEKVSLILSTFEEVYQQNFLDQDDLLEPEVLCLLSPENRVHVARKKIQKDPSWPTGFLDLNRSWRCFLPIDESIPILKDQISKTTDTERRCDLLYQLIYTCGVNKDENALLEVLEYIAARHKNECKNTLLRILDCIANEFEIHNLSHEHWRILDRLINISCTDSNASVYSYVTKRMLLGKLHFNLLQGLSITDPVKLLFNCKNDDIFSKYNWDMLAEHPAYERKCLMEFLEVAPSVCLKDRSETYLINRFLEWINNFNERILKTKSNVEPIAIENKWLLTQIQLFINSNKAEALRWHLKQCDTKFCNDWVKNNKMINLRSTEEYHQWKRNPDRIARNLEKYLQECTRKIHRKYAQRFIKQCQWHRNIPIRFTEICLKEVIENQNSQALIVLSLLLEGPVFENFICEFLSPKWTIDIDAAYVEGKHSMIQSVAKALSIVNPPVSLNVTAHLCKADIIHMAADSLKVLSRRTSIAKLLPFVKTFIDQPVSVSKQFIRIFSTIANTNECHEEYKNLWRSEKHQTIRTLVFDKILHLFVSNPNDETWQTVTECLDNLTADDKGPLNSMCCLDKIPDKYSADYVRKILKILKQFSDVVDHMDPQFIWSHIVDLLHLPVDIALIFPEELHEEILKTYFADLSLPIEVLAAAQYYLVNAYIEPALDKLESRFDYYSEMFKDILINQWDIPDPQRPNCFPVNYMVDSQMIPILFHFKNEIIREEFIDVTLKSFCSVLDPVKAPSFFCFYLLASLYRPPHMPREEYVREIGENMADFVGEFGEGFIPTLGVLLDRCLKLFGEKYGTHNENILNIIENLLELKNELTTLLAIAIPIPEEAKLDDSRYLNLLRTLRQQDNRSAMIAASTRINRSGYENIS